MGLVQVTLGVQVGGQTYRELVIYDSKEALEPALDKLQRLLADAPVATRAGSAAAESRPELH